MDGEEIDKQMTNEKTTCGVLIEEYRADFMESESSTWGWVLGNTLA